MTVTPDKVLERLHLLKQAIYKQRGTDTIISIDILAQSLRISRVSMYELLAILAVAKKVEIAPLSRIGFVDVQ